VSLYLGHNFLTHITKFTQFAETILTGFVFSKIFIYGVNNGKQKNKQNEHHKPTVQINVPNDWLTGTVTLTQPADHQDA